MSILIKGMEMPKNCEDCLLNGFIRCNLTNTKFELGKIKNDDCPLIELPPHGDLIDRDDLMSALLNKTYGVDINVVMKQIMEKIISAPILIEAEDSFFNSLKRGLEQAINGDVREITIIKAEDENADS